MKHYNYQKSVRELWEFAVKTYETGNREPSTYFSDEQISFMDSVGLKVMDLYDFAEDFVDGGDPDFETFLMITEARRGYFLNVQNGVKSTVVLDPQSIPSKTESVDGIVWLPRIIPKAKAKLRGELPEEMMFSCGGDRRFFKENDIHPAEFLQVVASHIEDDAAIIAWVNSRRNSS